MKPSRDFMDVARAIARGDAQAHRWLRASPELAQATLSVGATRAAPTEFFLTELAHHVYAGDTLLHVAAAAYAAELAGALVAAGADVRARNRRGAEPLHYAADGGPASPTWDPGRQAAMVTLLIAAGADPNALDRSGVAPLHRAVRTRCTGAVRSLLAGGADAGLRSKSGSSPRDLALGTTGRGGSGDAAAKREQAVILRVLAGE